MTVKLLLYSRPGCHLCDEMLSALEELDNRRQMNVFVVNIDEDPDLRREFSARIPVLVHAGTRQVLSEHQLDIAAVKACLVSTPY